MWSQIVKSQIFTPFARKTGIRCVSSTIHIHNLPLHVRREELQTAMNEFGAVTSLFFVKAKNGKSMIATITYKNVSSAIAVVDEMDDTISFSRTLFVKFSKKIDAPAIVRVPRMLSTTPTL